MVSKKENLDAIYKQLKAMNVDAVRTIEMAQGQKVTRVVCWTFLDQAKREAWLSGGSES